MASLFPQEKKTRGFTLIELLVVSAIIALLASVIVGSLSTMRQKARDSQRITAVKQVTTAIEFYKNQNNNTAPTHNTNPIGGCASFCLSSLTDELVPGYIGVLPLDPQYGNVASNGYRYCRGDAIGHTSEFDIMMWNEATGGWCNLQHSSNIIGTACWVTSGDPNNGWCNDEI